MTSSARNSHYAECCFHETAIKLENTAKWLDISIFYFITRNIKEMHLKGQNLVHYFTWFIELILRETGFDCKCKAVKNAILSAPLGLTAMISANAQALLPITTLHQHCKCQPREKDKKMFSYYSENNFHLMNLYERIPRNPAP